MTASVTKRRSIASQLILFFTLPTVLLLVCGLGVFYSLVLRHAFAEDNAVLADKISALRADFHENGPQLFAKELNTRQTGDRAPYWIRVLDSEGHILTEMPGMQRLLPPTVFPAVERGTASIRNRRDYRTDGKLFSLVAAGEDSGAQAYTLQVAQDRSSDERVETKFRCLIRHSSLR